jgi:hypothetical protein
MLPKDASKCLYSWIEGEHDYFINWVRHKELKDNFKFSLLHDKLSYHHFEVSQDDTYDYSPKVFKLLWQRSKSQKVERLIRRLMLKKLSFKRVFINTRHSRSSSHTHTLYQEDPMHTSRGRVHVRETSFQEVVFHSRIKDWRITTKFIPSAFQKTTLIHDSSILKDSRHTLIILCSKRTLRIYPWFNFKKSKTKTESSSPKTVRKLWRLVSTHQLSSFPGSSNSFLQDKITRTSFITIYH